MKGPEAIYQEHLSAGRLTLQRCGSCGAAIHYVRWLCPVCSSPDLAFETAGGGGSIYAFTLGTARMGGEGTNVALVDVAEGPRILTTIVGAEPETLAIGLRVRAEVEQQTDGPARLVFRPEPAQ